ncbi:MAG: pyridoxal-phosphate dependent enzyme [Anaerosomatales bacterium]|nr:pyridoxal-phosphate dependent enzyme [Anaerosomatales bacterium]
MAYPGLSALPRAAIAELPTPLVPMEALGRELGVGSLAVKRDDLTSARYGGNKVRKLQFLLGQALSEGRRAVVTFGAYGSNHVLATAVHARALGLEPHAVLSPQAPGPFARATLLAHAALGTQLHLAEGWDSEAQGARVAAELAERDGVEPLVVPMGGSAPRGVVGYVEAAFEIASQVEAGVWERPDVVYLAGGTLGTAVGLAIGFAALRWPTRVVAVRVTPEEVANEARAETLVAETVALLRSLDGSFPALRRADLALELRHDWFEPGYGVVTPETTAAVEMARRHGLALETTYTGKALAALTADARAGALAGARVLFLDTYNSAPMPAPGRVDALPEALRAYVAECERLFGPGYGLG